MSRSERFRCRGLTGRCRNISLASENATRIETPLFGALHFCDPCCVGALCFLCLRLSVRPDLDGVAFSELGITPRPAVTLELDQETPGAPASDNRNAGNVDATLSQWIAKIETADLNAKQFTNSVRISVIKNFNRALLSSMALCFRMRKSTLNQRVFEVFLKWINQLLAIPPISDLTPVKLNHLPLLISVICIIFETPNEFASMQPPPLPPWTLSDFPRELIDSIGQCFNLQAKQDDSDWIETKARWAAVRATLPTQSVSASNASTTTSATTKTSDTTPHAKKSSNKSTTSKSKPSVSESTPLTPRASTTPGNNESTRSNAHRTNSSETTTTTSSTNAASPKHSIPSPTHEIPSVPSVPSTSNSTSTTSASTTTTSTNPDTFNQFQFTTRAPIPTVAPNPRRRIAPVAPPVHSNHNSGSNSMHQVLSRITRLEAENSRLHQEVQRSRSRSRHRSLSRSRGVSHGHNRSRSPRWRNQNQSRQQPSSSGSQHHQRKHHNQARSHSNQAHSRADNHNRAHREVEVQKYAQATEYANFSPPQY